MVGSKNRNLSRISESSKVFLQQSESTHRPQYDSTCAGRINIDLDIARFRETRPEIAHALSRIENTWEIFICFTRLHVHAEQWRGISMYICMYNHMYTHDYALITCTKTRSPSLNFRDVTYGIMILETRHGIFEERLSDYVQKQDLIKNNIIFCSRLIKL